MKNRVLLDTGPLVAYLKRQDNFHQWAVQELEDIQPPVLTCEAVIVEACFLLKRTYNAQETILSLLNTGALQIPFSLSEEAGIIGQLMKHYQSVPMSLADACLVRMSELYPGSFLLTLDSDFKINRRNRNQLIATIMPESL